MTQQPPHRNGPYAFPVVPPAARPGWFRRLQPGQRVGAIVGGVLLSSVLLCCSGATLVGALADDPQQGRTPATANESTRGDSLASTPEPVAVSASPVHSDPAPVPSTAPPPTTTAPKVETRTETKTQVIRHAERTVKDPSLTEGKRAVRTRGVNGVRTLTYQVTLTDGVPTGRKLVRSVVTRQAVTQVVAVGTKRERRCDPNYGGCVPIASDVDCAGGSGNGPAYVTGPIEVIGDDIYDLDRDNDGYACDD
ncbi:G5 domain-containing protein [Micromonospora sp. NBC_01412]|uniref:G5 domain-containing protein n=1 Tax=Micromonospora sp. NBC_01412 TaxID=2903590 RepID=UPI003255911D